MSGLVATGTIDYAFLEIGAADAVFQFPKDLVKGKSQRFIDTVATNLAIAVDTVTTAGDVHVVIANIPDVTVTPYFRSHVTSDPVSLQRVASAITTANQRIQAFADARAIPAVDLFGLFHLTQAPMTLGGVAITEQFTPDGLHPKTALQGLLANTILEAMDVGYGEQINSVRLSDQDVLDLAGIPYPRGHTYFDVSPFVITHDETSLRATTVGGATEVEWLTAEPIERVLGPAFARWQATGVDPTSGRMELFRVLVRENCFWLADALVPPRKHERDAWR